MDIEKYLTQKSDIENNNSLSIFMGGAAQQHHNVYAVFYNFLTKIKPNRILEIGTAQGGFTNFLKMCCDDIGISTEIRSYDIIEHGWYDDIRKNGIDIRVENIFSTDYKYIQQDVIDFINKDGVTLVLCDGGNKIGEFNIIARHIKSGDFIMAHDYVDTHNNFIDNFKNKIWNWHEINDNDINSIVIENNLISYDKEQFDKVVWVCKYKNNE